MFLGFFIGVVSKGNEFLKERASIICLSCMGLEK